MKAEPGSPIQVISAVTDRHLISVIDMDRRDLKHLYITAKTAVQTLTGSSAPTDYAAAEFAALILAFGGANNDLTFTAVVPGTVGNTLSVEILQSVTPNDPLSISWVTPNAVITLPADGSGDPVNVTATVLKAAWDAHAVVAAITVAVEGTGAGNIGVAAAAALAGGVDVILGTGYGSAETGSVYTNYSIPAIYVNTGTIEEPVWQVA